MPCSRRDLVRGGLAGAALASSAVLPIGCGNPVQAAPILPFNVAVTAGVVTLHAVDSRYPDLVPVGGAITVPLLREDPSQPRAILLVHRAPPGDDPEYIAVDSECPHAACPLGYSAAQGLIECPCHGSRFLAAPRSDDPGSATGDVVHAPARSGTAAYDVRLDGTTLSISLGCAAFSVRVAFADAPALATAGGVVLLAPPTVPCKLVVARVDDTTALAVDATCTHQACTVAFDAGASALVCPCHGSHFALDGSVQLGPASAPLRRYVATLDPTGVTIASR
jgi:Rieske Fe-S protein